jgi:RsiW-degrading membrane proteinase PrsW (M82 family)
MLDVLYIMFMSSIPVLVWLSVYSFLNSKSNDYTLNVFFVGILFGFIAMIPVLLLQFFWNSYPELNFFRSLQATLTNFSFNSLFFLFVVLLEEGLKAIALIFLVRKYRNVFNQIVDGIVFGAIIALGFAFAENVYYFLYVIESYQFSLDFLAVFNLRSFGTMLSHTLFTGTFGVFYALDYLGLHTKELNFSFAKISKFRFTGLYLLPKFLHPKKIDERSILLEGFFFACLMHWIFNMLVKGTLYGYSTVYLTIPFLMICSFWLWSSFFIKENIQIFKSKK